MTDCRETVTGVGHEGSGLIGSPAVLSWAVWALKGSDPNRRGLGFLTNPVWFGTEGVWSVWACRGDPPSRLVSLAQIHGLPPSAFGVLAQRDES